MIKFSNKKDFLKVGLGFTDFFEETLFEYFLEKDGFMFYNPTDQFMYDKSGVQIFYVEQEYVK